MPTTATRLRTLSDALCTAPDLTPQGADLMVRLDAAANRAEAAAERRAYARVSQHFTGITAGLSPSDALLVAEQAVRRAAELLNRARAATACSV